MRSLKISVVKLLVLGFAMLVLGSSLVNAQETVTLPTIVEQNGASGTFEISTTDLTGDQVFSFGFTLHFDETILQIDAVNKTSITNNGLLNNTVLANANANGQLTVGFASGTALAGAGDIVSIDYTVIGTGTSALDFQGSFQYNNGTPAVNEVVGSMDVPPIVITVGDQSGFVGDTLLIPISTSDITPNDIYSFDFNFAFDQSVLQVLDYSLTGTMGANGFAQINPDNVAGTGNFAWAGGAPLPKQAGVLAYIKVRVIGKAASGSNFNVSNFQYNNGTPAAGATFPGVITITNRNPVFDPINDQTGAENSALSFSVNADDPDGDVVTYTIDNTTLPIGYSFNGTTGAFSWTPTYSDSGSYTIQFAASDGDGGSATSGVVNVTIDNTNRAPSLVLNPAGPYSVDENDSLGIQLVGTDPDVAIDDVLSYSATGLPTGASVDASSGLFTWTPGFNQQGVYNVTFTVTDSAGASDSEAAVITVNNVNGPPSWTVAGAQELPDTIAVEGLPLNYTYIAIDPEGDQVRYKLVAPIPSGASIGLTSGVFNWTPPVGSVGQHVIQVSADDQVNNAVVSGASTVDVIANTPPLVTLNPVQTTYNVDELTNVTFSVSTSDIDEVYGDNPALSVSGDLTGQYTAADPKNGTFDWTPQLGDAGTYQVTFTSTDLAGFQTARTVTINVAKNNISTVFVDVLSDTTVLNGSTLNFDYNATDVNPQDSSLVYSIVSSVPAGVTIDAATGELVWATSENQTKTYTLEVQVSDGTDSVSTSADVTIDVDNRAPVFSAIGDQSGIENSELTFTISATDEDAGDQITYGVNADSTDLPAGYSLDPNTGVFIWTPTYSDSGTYSAQFTATDLNSAVTLSEIVTITIANLNRAPSLALNPVGPYTVDEGQELSVTLVGTDADLAIDDSLTYSVSGLPQGAVYTIDQTTGVFSWTPAFDAAGDHNLTFTVTDLAGASDSESSVVTVNNVNGPPSFVVQGAMQLDSASIREGQTFTFTYKAIDPEGAVVKYFKIDPSPATSTIGRTSGVFTWTPPLGSAANSPYEIVIAASDDANTTISAIGLLTVEPNTTPVIAVDPVGNEKSVEEESTLDFMVDALDLDQGDVVTITNSALPAGASFVNGQFSWTPGIGTSVNSPYMVTFYAEDLSGAVDSVEVTINVTKNNIAPAFTKVLGDTTITVGETLTFDYDATDSNPQDTLTYSIVSSTPDATIDAATGVLTWVTDAAATTTYTLLVEVSDGSLKDTSTADVTIFVPTYSITGEVTYNNAAMTPISGVEASLTGDLSDSASSDMSGEFQFNGLIEGAYSVSLARSGDWGGVLSSDALLAALFFVDSANHPLDDIQKLAADVNDDGNIMLSDAQMILNRTVGKISSFTKPDWVFSPATWSYANLTTDDTVAVKTLATGDVNGSYSVTQLPKESIAVNNDEIVNASSEEFEVVIKVKDAAEIGAFTLRIPYPTDKLEYVSAKGSVNMLSNDKDGVITLAWADLSTKNSLKVEDNGSLIVLTFKATESFTKTDEVNLTFERGSEVVDKFGEQIVSKFSIPTISKSIPKEFALTQNYPNPFNPSTTIKYDLPQAGKVRLVIFNSLGQEVATLFNEVKEAGSYKAEWNASQMASGIYFYRLTVEGSKNFVMTKKMILLK